MKNDTDSYTYLPQELLNLCMFPHHDRYFIPGLIETSNEALVIGALSQVGNFTEQKHLAVILGISRPAITAVTSEMMRKGLITQEPNPNDHRGYLLSLTEKGKRAALWMIERKRDYNKILVKGLTKEQIQTYNEVTIKMAENILDASERELSHMVSYEAFSPKIPEKFPSFISLENQDLFISMAKRTRKIAKSEKKDYKKE